MQDFRPQGNLKDIPFPHLLFRLWESEKSGHLKVKNEDFENHLYFSKGNIAVDRGFFPGKDFLKIQVEKNILDLSLVEECERYAHQNKCTLVKALHELGPLSSSRIWTLMEDYIRANCFPLFDCLQAEYLFETEYLPRLTEILFTIPTPGFILQGIRQMANYDNIKAHIPQENESIQISSPEYLNSLNLESPEKYVLASLEKTKSLKNIYNLSELGEKETQKIIFALYSLGLIEPSQKKRQEDLRQQPSLAEVDKILDAFNQKFSYIYKFVSKKLGPVAYNVIEKCLEETKPDLSSLFQNIKFDSKGKIEKHSLLKTNMSLINGETRMNLIKDLNEILASEVLAVKKNLGNEHESLLIKNLEKIGEES